MKKIEEIKAIIEKYIQDTYKEDDELIECFNTASIDDILEKSYKYFTKFLKQINHHIKYYDIVEEDELNSFITEIFNEIWTEDFTSGTLQNRIFILKNYKGFGSVSIEKQGFIASHVKKYEPLAIIGDLCWGYKNGSSTIRTAMILLNEVIYNFSDENEDFEKMSYCFADEILSIFQQNKPARIEEAKIIDWVNSYKEKHGLFTDINIIKKTCKELEINQKELSEILATSDGTVRNWSSSNNPPQWAINFMNVLIENQKNKLIAIKLKELISLI